MAWHDLATALCLVFVIEGIVPFLAPARWREAARRASAIDDATVRWLGLGSMLLGTALLYLIH